MERPPTWNHWELSAVIQTSALRDTTADMAAPKSDDQAQTFPARSGAWCDVAGIPRVPLSWDAQWTEKLVIFSALTGTLYLLYWNFLQWKAWAAAQGRRDINPLARTLLMPVYVFELFRRISAKTAGGSADQGALAAVFAVVHVLSIAGLLTGQKQLFLLIYVGIVPVAVMQKQINAFARSQNPRAELDEKFSSVEVLLCLVGAFFLLFTPLVLAVPTGFWGH